MGESVSSVIVETATKRSGAKYSTRNRVGSGGISGTVRVTMTRSKGNSKTKGAASAPQTALKVDTRLEALSLADD